MCKECFGYVRVSTKDQNEARQLISMQGLSIPEKNIFLDKQSGKDFNRPQYKKMIKKLLPVLFCVPYAIQGLQRQDF